jgi:hypothetical protein
MSIAKSLIIFSFIEKKKKLFIFIFVMSLKGRDFVPLLIHFTIYIDKTIN